MLEWMDNSYEMAAVFQNVRYGLLRIINDASQETTLLRYHWPLIYILISPITLIFKNPIILLLISVGFFALGAHSMYLLTKHYTKSATMSFWISCVYVFYLPVHLSYLFDFHADPLAIPFILLSFLFSAKKNWIKYFIAMFLALSCKEYVGLVYFGYGIWMFFKQNKLMGAITALIGMSWFLAVIIIFIPHFNLGNKPLVLLINYADLGATNGIMGMIKYSIAHYNNLFSQIFTQNNIGAIIFSFLPMLFIPTLRPLILSMGGLIVLKNALSSSGMNLLNHREALFTPFVFLGFILYISEIKDKHKKQFFVIAVTICVAITFLLQGKAFPARGFWLVRSFEVQTDRDKLCERYLAQIPKDASLMASSRFTARLIDRKDYYLFPRSLDIVKPQYILVDSLEQRNWEWLDVEEREAGLKSLINNKEYELKNSENGLYLFVKVRK